MNILKSINVGRRFLMHSLTKNIGNSHFNQNIDHNSKIKVKRVLICRPNARLGNLLLLTPLLQEVSSTFPQCKIDLFVKGNLAPILFKNYKNVDHIIHLPGKPFKHLIKYIKAWTALRRHNYDIVINVSKNSSSGKLSAQFANSKYKFSGDFNEDIKLKYDDYEHIAKYPVYNFRNYLDQMGLSKNEQSIPLMNLKLSFFEIANGKKLLKKIVNNEKKTICLFTYATGNKCYSESWWEDVYQRLLVEFPNYNIIEVLPKENISQIGFKAPTYYSKNLRKIGALIANTELFIGADSGMMHLASAVLTPTVGLFSITDENIYQPYNNNSIAINTNDTDIESWIDKISKILFSSDNNPIAYTELGLIVAALIN